MRDTLSLAGRELVIESPAEAFELLRRFYPHRWRGAARGAVDLSLTVDGDSWRLHHDGLSTGPLTGALQAAFALEHEIEKSLIAGCGDRIALHAGGVEVAGRAHLVAGAADTGKTTATLQLVELGHGFLCEEVALIEPETLAVASHPRALTLDARHLDEIARRQPLARGEIDRLDDRLARYRPHRVHLAPATLEAVYLPRLRSGPPRVEKLDPADVLPEILGYCFAPAGDEERFFERVIRMLDSCRVVRVQFDGIAGARRLWQRLLPGKER